MRAQLETIKLFLFPCKENDYRPSSLDGKFLFYVTFVLVVLKFISLFYFTLIPKTLYFADVTRGALIQMTNIERSKAGLNPLSENLKLTKAAELKAQDMLDRGYFSHWSPGGISPWHWFRVAGYNYRYAGENLAIGFLNAKDVHRAWMASFDHRNNIMGPDYNDIGIAVVEADFYGQRAFLVVQVFGSRKVAPVASALEPIKPIVTEELIVTEKAIIKEELPVKENNLIVEERRSFVLGVGPTILSGETLETGGLKYSIFNFLMIKYDDLVRQIIFFVMMFLGFVMAVMVINALGKTQHPDLIFKGLAFLVLFLVFYYFDQMTLVRMLTEAPWIG